jgi:hypothetical protein
VGNVRVASRAAIVAGFTLVLACASGSSNVTAPSGDNTSGGDGGVVFPLKVAPSGRFLVDQRGVPFLVNGDTPWSLTHNLTYDESVRYMENRRAKGINALIVSTPDAYGPDGSANDPPDRQGNHPFLANDVTRPNEPYWQHVDQVLAKSEEMGFLVLFFPAYLGCYNDGYVALFQGNGAGRARTYGRFVGQRYGARKNLVWVHGGDLNPGAAADVVVAVRDGIRDAAPSHLHAAHWSPETDPYGPLGDDFTDLYTTYTYGPVSAQVFEHYSHPPTKPVLLLETHYENDWAGKAAAEVRTYPYRALLSGATGHFFGNKPLWFCGYGWESALDSPGSRAMEYVGKLFRSRPWQMLVPDRGGLLVAAGGGDPGTDDGVQAARAEDGSFAMAFVPDARAISVDLARISGSTVRAWWFDVVTGAATSIGDFPASGVRSFSPPQGDGRVLVLDDASRGFPPPGEGSTMP